MIDWVSEIRNKPFLDARQYNFPAQSPGGALTSGVQATINVVGPVYGPANGTDTHHYIRISGGTGTAEAVLVTGGTYVSGALTGTIIFTPANNHSGAWTWSSATAGAKEAFVSLNGNPGAVSISQVRLISTPRSASRTATSD